MRPASMPPYRSSLEDRGDDTAVSLGRCRLVAEDRTVLAFDRADLALVVGLGLAVCAFTAEAVRLGAVPPLVPARTDRGAVRRLAGVVAGRPARRDLPTELADLTEPADLTPV